MRLSPDILAYHAAQRPALAAICDALATALGSHLPTAEAKVWHGGPVWFLAGNPIAGYWSSKHDVRLMFWSGQSFDEADLVATGKFKAAEVRFASAADVEAAPWPRWLGKARDIQWDYKNIVKRRGQLEWLVQAAPGDDGPR